MNLLRIALNDMRVVLKDRMVIVWWLAMPLAFIFMFSFMMGDHTQDSTWLPVFQFDSHPLADIFLEQLKADKFNIDKRDPNDEQWIGGWPRALIIPATFSQDILQGRRVDLTLTKGKESPEKTLAAQTLLVRSLIKFNTAVAGVDVMGRGWSDQTRQDLEAELGKTPVLTVQNERHASLRPPPTGFAFTFPAYFVMFAMMMTIMYGGITLVYERTEKRLNRLAAMPVSVLEIFLGKMLARMLQPALQGGILILASVTLFKLNLGDHPLALIPVILSFAYFCGSLGLLAGVLCRTEQQVVGTGILLSNALAALGGCWWPLEVVPQTFKTIARFTPSYWAIRGLQDVISFGKSWMDVLPECGILAGFGLIFTAIAIPAFKWE